jgi:hypothetical protein
MGLSGTRTFKMSFYDIVDSALRKIGGNASKAAEFAVAKKQLNLIMSDLQNQGQQLWTRQNDLIPLVKGTATYTLDANAIDADLFYFRYESTDTFCEAYTREDYARIATKTTPGNPNRVYVDWQLAAPTASLWPVYGANTGFILGTDGKYYICTVSHTSAAATRPITGASYASYWEEVTFKTTAIAWVTATAYDSGHVRFTKILRAEDLSANANDPDAPVRWQNALVWELANSLAPDYGLQKWERQDLQQRAAIALMSAKAGNKEGADMRIYPRLGM